MTKLKSNMIDTHCHLEAEEFDMDRDQVVERANSKKISIISSGISPVTWLKNLIICEKYDTVFATLGLSPTENQHLHALIPILLTHRVNLVAIGECGLDYYLERNHTEREKQEDSFLSLIRIAQEFNLPIQVHSRSAGKAAITLLEKAEVDLVHMHAFDAKASIAKFGSFDLGYYFSIPTSVVRSPQKQKLVKAVDIERLLVETDSPVLGAEKQTRNEPANLPIAISEIAKILMRSEEEMESIILENTLRLYTKISDK